MALKLSFLKTTAFFTALIYLSGMAVFPLVPKAQALFWEDDNGDNDPKEEKTRPSHFFLGDAFDGLNKNATKQKYKEMDNHDKGASVNNSARTLVIVASGVVGLGLGLFLANRFNGNNADTLTSDMFVGGALGLGAGILIGVLIMPTDYNVDQRAKNDFMKQRQAWFQDPLQMQIAQSFHSPQAAFSLEF